MATKKGKTLVFIQFILFGLFLIEPNWKMVLPVIVKQLSYVVSGIGGILIVWALAQQNRDLSAFPDPGSRKDVIVKGAYRIVRHPIYTGIICIALGVTGIMSSMYKLGISFLLMLLFNYKSRYEETLLIKRFPSYTTYQKEVGRLFPMWFSMFSKRE